MYRVPRIGSNAARIYGMSVKDVTVKRGRKYFADDNGHKYPIAESEADENGNEFWEEYDAVYGRGDYLLYTTEEAAQDYIRREAVLSRLLPKLSSRIGKCSLPQLSRIYEILEETNG